MHALQAGLLRRRSGVRRASECPSSLARCRMASNAVRSRATSEKCSIEPLSIFSLWCLTRQIS